MAYDAITAPQTTYDTTGIKEDVSDIIGLISPYDTPCYSQFRKTTAMQTTVQWQEDFLRDPADNINLESEDPTDVAATGNPTMQSNFTQIFDEYAQVSGTMQAVELYGRSNEMDYQVMKKAREVRRDIEYALCGVVQAGTIGDKTTARQLKSMGTLVDAGVTDDNAGTPRAYTEDLVLAVHELVFNKGGDPNQLLVTPAHSIAVANFAYATGRSRDVENETRLVNKVDLYASPFGELSVVIDRWLAADDSYLLEVDRWYLPVLRPMVSEPLAKTGDSEKRLITCELTVAQENTEASGRIADLTATGA